MTISAGSEQNQDETANETPGSPDRARSLHVALDLRLYHNSGIGNYLKGLLHGFAQLDEPIEWTFIGPQVPVPAALKVRAWVPFDAKPYSWQEFRRYPRLSDVDLLHYPHYNLPMAGKIPVVVTVYDIFHLVYGSFAKRLYQRFFLFRLAHGRAQVLAISGKTHDDLEARSSIPERKITTINLGPGRPQPSAKLGAPLRSTITLHDGKTLSPPWFLAMGIDKFHKNMDFLISAMALWYRRRSNAPPLLWVGLRPDQIAERTASVPAHARAKIHFEPYRPDDETESLYAGAMALIFPSMDEGFGFPPLEAMVRGVPVLCSRRRPMTDLLGAAPLWFDPGDSATLWRGLDRLLDERGLHDEASERGLRQAAKYNWRETARKTLEVYRKVAAGPSR